MVKKAVITATRELVERQTNIESNLLGKIDSLQNEFKHYKCIMAYKLIDSKICDDALKMYNSVMVYGAPQNEAEKNNTDVTTD